MIEYQLIRSKRKTISLSFDSNGELVVKAPVWVRKGRIDAFVEEKAEWIEANRIRLQRAREEALKNRLKLESGDELYFLGEKRILTVIREDRKRSKVVCAMDRLLLYVPYEADYDDKRDQLEKWYRKEAAVLLEEKAEEFAGRLLVTYEDIRIKDQKSRWGSCSSKGNLNFNWRIVMAPEPVCDYVVIHEL
ncbi:MAG: M48 family metallopeptidase, partial [Lachnospiraceae bacterium]|nr:M48 family metallopeptidase [Lachnospiraceae bacterium]